MPESIDQILSSIHTQLNFDLDVEITLEANPGAVEAARFREYRAIGVNRLSLGIQSFNNQSLTLLGRIHDADEAKKHGMANQLRVPKFNIKVSVDIDFE